MTITEVSALYRGKLVRIPIEQIRYFKSDRKYISVFYDGGELLLTDTIDRLELELAGDFIRIHRGTLVRRSLIKKLWRNAISHEYELRLKGYDQPFRVARRRMRSVRNLIASRKK